MNTLNKSRFQKVVYIEVVIDEKLDEDDKFENIALKIEQLLKDGVNSNDIAILTYTNDDVLNLYYYLKQKFKFENFN